MTGNESAPMTRGSLVAIGFFAGLAFTLCAIAAWGVVNGNDASESNAIPVEKGNFLVTYQTIHGKTTVTSRDRKAHSVAFHPESLVVNYDAGDTQVVSTHNIVDFKLTNR